MNDLETFLAALGAPATLTAEEDAISRAQASRARATRNCRAKKVEDHASALAAVDGDREALKTICLWVPRKTNQKLMARAFDKKACAEGGERFTDAAYEVEVTEYDLEEVEVERARHPKEEVEFAKLQRRFRESTPSIQGFFHKPFIKTGDRRSRRVLPAPLGDFAWVERSEELSREQELNRSLAALRASRPIRNVREAC
jgi:hypothetical protein